MVQISLFFSFTYSMAFLSAFFTSSLGTEGSSIDLTKAMECSETGRMVSVRPL